MDVNEVETQGGRLWGGQSVTRLSPLLLQIGSASSVWSTPAPIEPASPSNTFTARTVRSKTGPGKSFQHLLSGLMRKVGTTRSLELCSDLYKKGSAPLLHLRKENTTWYNEGWNFQENKEFSLPSSLPFPLAFLSLLTFPPLLLFFSFPFPSLPSLPIFSLPDLLGVEWSCQSRSWIAAFVWDVI